MPSHRQRYRHILTTAFDRYGDAWLYYSNAWAEGVEVSSEEREAYLSGRREEWYGIVASRDATAPRRPYCATVRRLLLATIRGYDPSEPIE
jgi:hypothetical protein